MTVLLMKLGEAQVEVNLEDHEIEWHYRTLSEEIVTPALATLLSVYKSQGRILANRDEQ